ncbi:MAG: serine/threonine protein kinase [Gemmataceae bacterium]|nr:serine/threonine protein kinase [Gemmataceae bacterium]
MAEEVIGGYKLINCMHSGQSSQIWEVVELASGRHFAMKLLLPEKVADRELRNQLLHEARVGKALAHPNIIRIQHVGNDGHQVYIVMDFFPQNSLAMRLVRKDYQFVRERIHSILKQGAVGLAYMNASGWVHRDIKPHNMLVNAAGELRIIDFALAVRVQKPGFFGKLFRRRPPIQGTRSYMSPEQILGQPLDGRADIYSFGATAYELTTYRPPFRAASAQELLRKHLNEPVTPPIVHNPELTEEFSQLIVKMLAKKREDRPQSFHEVLKTLNTIRIYKNDPIGRPSGP